MQNYRQPRQLECSFISADSQSESVCLPACLCSAAIPLARSVSSVLCLNIFTAPFSNFGYPVLTCAVQCNNGRVEAVQGPCKKWLLIPKSQVEDLNVNVNNNSNKSRFQKHTPAKRARGTRVRFAVGQMKAQSAASKG